MAIAAKSFGIDSCIVGSTRFMYNQTNKVDINRMLKIPMEYEHDCAMLLWLPQRRQSRSETATRWRRRFHPIIQRCFCLAKAIFIHKHFDGR
ncbi:MAG: hypothetical protein MZU97_19450 [Bacillus subtilis]|nr:hypothetical protein [Bacillus subtilis]